VLSSGSFFRPSLEGLGLWNSGLGTGERLAPRACGRLSAGGRVVFHEMTIMWVPMRTIVFFQYIVHLVLQYTSTAVYSSPTSDVFDISYADNGTQLVL
jgi:hypothetical protein